MDLSKITAVTSTLPEKIQVIWQKSKAVINKLIDTVLPQIKYALQTVRSVTSVLIKKLDNLINAIAAHPFLDKLENAAHTYKRLISRVWEQQRSALQQRH